MSHDVAVRLDIPEKLRGVVRSVLDRKAVDLRVLHIGDVSDFTEFFLICSGTSERQVQAIADAVVTGAKEAGIRPLGVEGYSHGSWILVDYGDMVIHIFSSDNRSVYGLEKLWSDATDITDTFLSGD
ncbi:MAG: ribosome silencing factor [bacterium]|nr:ribosome silencing factor [bacterium]